MVDLTLDLKLKLKNLPTSPGVYLFKNARGRIIYIGKAKNLRNRVRTYFHSSADHAPRTARLVTKIVDLELLLTDNEIEALILEANLVRQHKPRYNVDLKDDKHFPYIKVTTRESFPRMLIVRRIENDGATYFGPYTSSRHMRRTVSFLIRLFKIRSCNFVLPPPKGKKVPVCLDYHIKHCGGPCEEHQTEEEYGEGISAALMVLAGKSKSLAELLTKRMQVASEALDYEEAAKLRDQIDALQAMGGRQKVDIGQLIDRDIIALAREEIHAVAVVLQIREGVLIGRQDFQLKAENDHTDEDVLRTFLMQYYGQQPNLPRELFVPHQFPDMKLFAKWLKTQKGRRVKLVMPQIGVKVRLVELARRNARLLLDELLIQKRKQSERTSKMVTSLKDDLRLVRSPRKMVCFDISNTGETDAVGSCVFFANGQPRKKEYRHFKIKTVQGQDDYQMMREVVGRYFRRRLDEDLALPDLVVLDGGKGQLSSVMAELVVLNLTELPVIGLAKRLEEIFVPGVAEAISIRKTSPSLMLLKRIRDEAHRFAVTYNRKVRSKRTIKSQLDEVKGIGPAKRALLLREFGSVKQIRKLSVEKLASMKGISPKLAGAILEVLA
ncbi:MAG: excinuclease ABC subunit UvrC [candidate division Zixibacteria bacterium]|nr:excinuclease ABC subunit UvrC [candidate division Zixibacteria bacterium]